MTTASTFKSAIPILPTPIISGAMRFYERLGFRCRWEEEHYGIVTRDGVELQFFRLDDRHVAEHSGCRIMVSGVEALYAEMIPLEIVHPNAPLQATAWGTNEFAILDLAGNIVTFVERIE